MDCIAHDLTVILLEDAADAARLIDMPGKPSPSIAAAPERHRQRFVQLMGELQQLEFFCKGTALWRMMRCGKAQCACQKDPAKRHGPYFQCTYYANGKTVTINLAPQAAPLYRAAVRSPHAQTRPTSLDGMAKNPKERFEAEVPAGQKMVVRQKPGGADLETRIRLAYRLLNTPDDTVHTLMKRRGDLSGYMIAALESADFLKMPLVDITMEAKASEVNMFMSDELYKKIRAAAEKRDVSLNVISSSAIARWLSKKGIVDVRPI